MVEFALITGVFSYIIFSFGIISKLSGSGIICLSVIYSLTGFFYLLRENFGIRVFNKIREITSNKICLVLLEILLLSALVNLIGALGPELGFDALWYHLTLPKVFLQENRIFYLKGGLFYYSLMPKLTEMLYLASLKISSFGILAKLIHYFFGILSSVALYKLARRYLNTRFSLLATVLFYTTLIVGWESITANVDLSRTFFEILSLDLFLKWLETSVSQKKSKGYWEKNIYLTESAVLLGLAISSKLIAFVSLPVFLLIILWKTKKPEFFIHYLFFSFLTVSPWLIFSFLKTGNPVFPVFSGTLNPSHDVVVFKPIRFLSDFWQLLYRPQDPISPVFLIFLPVVFLRMAKLRRSNEFGKVKTVLAYLGLAFLGWYFTPRIGGSRFILPYLPALSLCFVWIISLKADYWQKIFTLLVIFSSVLNIGYRFMANKKFISVIFEKKNRQSFLIRNLDFKNGDFLDINQEIKTITKNNYVLILGSHNLFYADFPFRTDIEGPFGSYNYIATQNISLPDEFKNSSRLIFQNPVTYTNLYAVTGL